MTPLILPLHRRCLCADSLDPYFERPALVGSIPGNKCVVGLTILDGELYVLRSQTATIEVQCIRVIPITIRCQNVEARAHCHVQRSEIMVKQL